MLKILKINIWIGVLIFLTYFIAAFGKGGEFFANDFKNKKAVAGSVVTAMIKIFGTPGIPNLSGNYLCSDEGISSIRLNWIGDDNTTQYDVYRDGVILAFDLTENFYVDLNVDNEASYEYHIVARGPGGSTDSEKLSLSTKKCSPKITPFVEITVFDGKNVFSGSPKQRTKNRTPEIIGTTNIKDANIELEIYGEEYIFASTVANTGGTWHWSPINNLKYGNYVIYVKAISPEDSTINVSSLMFFEIYQEEKESDKDEEKDKKSKPKITNDFETETRPKIEKPFDFDLSLENTVYIKGVSMNEEAYRGESLLVGLQFSEITLENRYMEISYEVIDSKRDVVARYSDRLLMKKDMLVSKEISLPYEFELGRYQLKINATVDNMTVSHEAYFDLVDRPILKIGAIGYMTYADIVNNLGWLAVLSTVFIGFFSILAIWEHHLYKRGRFHITEITLKRRGLID